jgi:hypothetical protein
MLLEVQSFPIQGVLVDWRLTEVSKKKGVQGGLPVVMNRALSSPTDNNGM